MKADFENNSVKLPGTKHCGSLRASASEYEKRQATNNNFKIEFEVIFNYDSNTIEDNTTFVLTLLRIGLSDSFI